LILFRGDQADIETEPQRGVWRLNGFEGDTRKVTLDQSSDRCIIETFAATGGAGDTAIRPSNAFHSCGRVYSLRRTPESFEPMTFMSKGRPFSLGMVQKIEPSSFNFSERRKT
jgi:hypothetical protein